VEDTRRQSPSLPKLQEKVTTGNIVSRNRQASVAANYFFLLLVLHVAQNHHVTRRKAGKVNSEQLCKKLGLHQRRIPHVEEC
jgi:hypothetical protein